jgi:hypothetical protein
MPKPMTHILPNLKLEKRGRRPFTVEYKLSVLQQADACQHGELGPLLRVRSFIQTSLPSGVESSLNIGAFTASTSTLMLALMFIGDAPNSTASGDKISIFVILLAATRSFLRGNLNVSFFCRSLSQETVLKALAVVTTGMITVFLRYWLLLL